MQAAIYHSPIGDIIVGVAIHKIQDQPHKRIEFILFEDDKELRNNDKKDAINIIKPANEDILAQTLEQLDQYFRGKTKQFNIDYVNQGSDFERCVWQEASKLGYAESINYEMLAKQIGNVNAARAVGNALARNKMLIVVPCHRVVAKNSNSSKLSGYRGGILKKQWLIDHEISISRS